MPGNPAGALRGHPFGLANSSVETESAKICISHPVRPDLPADRPNFSLTSENRIRHFQAFDVSGSGQTEF
ncbi:MAG: hypothetical protein B6245_08820 [Desulfobacteraceae bacterium 4572_88]|nr:MAG: hypothetical protein B6245_08820 [Desulfobacteraceae bacterium 4572_88]